MCLIVTNSPEQQIALQEITCYKVVRQLDNTFISPYLKYPFIFGKLEYATLQQFPEHNLFFDELTVERGFHTFAHLCDARIDLACWNHRAQRDKYCVCKCVIPANSMYYKGIYYGAVSYASELLIVKGVETYYPIIS